MSKKKEFLGSLKKILLWFFNPTKLKCGNNTTLKDKLEFLFGVEYRDVSFYSVKKNFEIPPRLFWDEGGAKMRGVGERRVRAGERVLVRMDLRKGSKEMVDIEHNCSAGRRPQVFTITKEDWLTKVFPYVKRIESRSGKKSKVMKDIKNV